MGAVGHQQVVWSGLPLQVRQLCFSELGGSSLGSFDVVVSNPPYLTQSQAKELCQLSGEDLHCFTLKRTQEGRHPCEGVLDGAIAVYALILAAVTGPGLRPGGALVLEVPSCLEKRVQRLVLSREGIRGRIHRNAQRDAALLPTLASTRSRGCELRVGAAHRRRPRPLPGLCLSEKAELAAAMANAGNKPRRSNLSRDAATIRMA
eukprot:Skav201505  [mRNA]  locus=scaffold1154:291878:296338:+ [translate_table: standard]